MEPLACPICGRLTIERLLEAVRITAKVDGEQNAGGILAYRCTVFGHIFFVRQADVCDDLAAQGSEKEAP